MKNQHLWIVGMVLMGCGIDWVWRLFGIAITSLWFCLEIIGLDLKDKLKKEI